jgi:uncharacterized protein
MNDVTHSSIFEKPGSGNTEQTLKLAHSRATALGIKEVVLATTTGDTALKALDIFSGFTVVAVTYHCGFKDPFVRSMKPEIRKTLEQQGVKIVEATHALSGVERSLSKKYSGIYPVMIIADTLRLFGQGTKVAVEISVMAADGGMLSGSDIVAIGGSGRGADSALIIKPAHMSNFLDLKIREIICKPRDI